MNTKKIIMEAFSLVIDRLATIWDRTYVIVEAESLQEAIMKCNSGNYIETDSETLYDTLDYISPNEVYPVTEEIYDADDICNPLFTNNIKI